MNDQLRIKIKLSKAEKRHRELIQICAGGDIMRVINRERVCVCVATRAKTDVSSDEPLKDGRAGGSMAVGVVSVAPPYSASSAVCRRQRRERIFGQ